MKPFSKPCFAFRFYRKKLNHWLTRITPSSEAFKKGAIFADAKNRELFESPLDEFVMSLFQFFAYVSHNFQ